jgi:hypothetical protein
MPVAICRVPNGIMPAGVHDTTRQMVHFDIRDNGNAARRLTVFQQGLPGQWDLSDAGVNSRWCAMSIKHD